MEAIKKSMLQMKKENEKAQDKSDAMEEVFKVADTRATKAQEEVDELNKKLSQLEAEFAVEQTALTKANKDLEAKEQAVIDTELKRNKMNADLNQKDEKFENVEQKLKSTADQLESTQRVGDEAARLVKVMESWAKSEGNRLKQIEKDLKEVTTHSEESDKKIEETCQKMGMVEEEIEFAEERVGNNEMKISQLEEEVQVVGNNLKSLEVSQEMSRQAEIEFKETIRSLTEQCKKTESRASFAEKTVQKLMKDVDRLEDDLRTEHEKLKSISIEMEATIAEMK